MQNPEVHPGEIARKLSPADCTRCVAGPQQTVMLDSFRPQSTELARLLFFQGGSTLERLPRLEYTGQTTPELLDCKNSHSILSLLFAFEWGIQAKAKQVGEAGLTDEERLVLAVLALDREVNNGGYHQFFWNSSRRFSPMIVESLRRIGRTAAASLTERAITALRLKSLTVEAVEQAILEENTERDAILDACDKEFYKLDSADESFFKFIEDNQSQIQLVKTEDYPRFPVLRKLSASSKLNISLSFWKKGWNPTLEEAREAAREIVKRDAMSASEKDIEGAAVLYVLGRSVRSGDVETGTLLAPRAFEMMHDEPSYIIVHSDWIKLLVQSGQSDLADAMSLSYLEYLTKLDQSEIRTKNSILFLAPVMQENREALPRSVEFFTANFPMVDLDKPLPRSQVVIGRTAPGTGPRRPETQ